MNYFKTRKKYMLNNIFNKANNGPEYFLVAIVFNKKIAEFEIYKFKSNQYTKTILGKIDWVEMKYIEDLSWDELMVITKNIQNIDASNFENWIKNSSECYKYKIFKNIYNIIF